MSQAAAHFFKHQQRPTSTITITFIYPLTYLHHHYLIYPLPYLHHHYLIYPLPLYTRLTLSTSLPYLLYHKL